MTLQLFDKWSVEFVGPINPLGKRIGARYIITMTNYLTRWDEATPIVDFTTAMATSFLFDNIVTQFGFPRILMSDYGSHFINHKISALKKEL